MSRFPRSILLSSFDAAKRKQLIRARKINEAFRQHGGKLDLMSKNLKKDIEEIYRSVDS